MRRKEVVHLRVVTVQRIPTGSSHDRGGRFFDGLNEDRCIVVGSHRALGIRSDPGSPTQLGAALTNGERKGSPVRDFFNSEATIAEKQAIALIGKFTDATAGTVTRCIAIGCTFAQS